VIDHIYYNIGLNWGCYFDYNNQRCYINLNITVINTSIWIWDGGIWKWLMDIPNQYLTINQAAKIIKMRAFI
jgi:hypothetical protein